MDSWTKENVLQYPYNKSHTEGDRSDYYFLKPCHYNRAAKIISFYFLKYPMDLNILEIFAGDCTISKIFFDEIKSNVKSCAWLSTELFVYKKRESSVDFLRCNAIDSVVRKGQWSNVLLMVSPPFHLKEILKRFEDDNGNVNENNEHENKKIKIDGRDNNKEKIYLGYGDYYACHDYIEQTQPNERKYVIYVGAFSPLDGSQGMYKYLTENEFLKLEYREVFLEFPNRDDLDSDKKQYEFAVHIFSIQKK
jgi:hypothetical protein